MKSIESIKVARFNSERRLALFMFSMIGVNYPIWFYFVKWLRPDLIDDLVSRIFIGAVGLVMMIFFWNKTREYLSSMRWSLFAIMTLMFGHYCWLSAINGNSNMHGLGIIMILNLGFASISFKKGLWSFALIASAMAFYISFYVESQTFSTGMLFVVVANISMLLLVMGISNINRDLALEKMQEDLIGAQEEIAKQRARELENSKLVVMGEMAGGVAHEINNPLAIMGASIELAQDAIAEEHPAQKYLDKILQSSSRISNVVNSLLLFVGKRPENGSDSEVIKIFANIEDLYGRQLERGSISLSLECEDPKMRVNCEASELVRTLSHMINNSVYAVSDVEEKWIKISAVNQADGIYFYIADSGHGIESELVSKLTDPFFTTKPVGTGMGLGLSIVHGATSSHGGHVVLKQQVPTTFELFFPHARHDVDQAG